MSLTHILGAAGILLFLIIACWWEGIGEWIDRQNARQRQPAPAVCGCRYLPEPVHCHLHATEPELWAAFEADVARHDYVSWDHCLSCYTTFEEISNRSEQ